MINYILIGRDNNYEEDAIIRMVKIKIIFFILFQVFSVQIYIKVG